MVKADITISTCYGDAVIAVEVLGKGAQPGTARVHALNGLEPFTRTSHGGPYQTSTSTILIPHLRDIRIEHEPGEELLVELAPENGNETPLPLPAQLVPADWFLESAHTVCAQQLGGRKV